MFAVKQKKATRVERIATRLRIPKATVNTIINEYLNDLRESVCVRHEDICCDGLFSVHLYKDGETGRYVPRGRVSTLLKQTLDESVE